MTSPKFAIMEQGRTLPLRMPPNWQPPYPSVMSTFADEVSSIAMAVVGCQFDPDQRALIWDAVTDLIGTIQDHATAAHRDIAECTDGTGRQQVAVTIYWLDPSRAADFLTGAAFAAWWSRHAAAGLPYGVFRESFNIPRERYETLHSGPDHIAGVANARTGITGEVPYHAYWGGMRDRIPASAHDIFAPDGAVTVLERGDCRVVVRPNENLAIIRSGQDWSRAAGRELEEYRDDVEPVLRKGLQFLRDDGGEVGCLDCRYMRFVDEQGEQHGHTFGLAYFRSLKDLEDWAQHHPTHQAIFNAFLEFAPRYGPEMRSRYWHEVAVVPAAEQWMEYVNCAPGTGLSPTR